jgi:transposase-like protein
MVLAKKCTKCGIIKPIEDFGNHRLTKDGRAYRCKQCAREYSRAHRKTASGIYSALKGRQTYARTHYGEKDRGYHLTIKPMDIPREVFVQWYDSQPKKCAYCDIPQDKLGGTQDKYNDKNLRLSVDCKINLMGYILGNLVLACSRCNAIKSDFFTHAEMIFIGQNFVKPKWTLGKVKT